jgi:hypothetical protein
MVSLLGGNNTLSWFIHFYFTFNIRNKLLKTIYLVLFTYNVLITFSASGPTDPITFL